MSINNNRPGVYSRYDISSVLTQSKSAGYAAVIAVSAQGRKGEAVLVESMEEALAAFGADAQNARMTGCIQVLLACGVSRIYGVSAGTPGDTAQAGDYEECMAALSQVENIWAIVSDAEDTASLARIMAGTLSRSENRREAVAFCGVSPDDAAAAASALNCERVVLCTPACSPLGSGDSHPVYGAAAMAGLVLSKDDCIHNFNGEQLTAVEKTEALDEAKIQSLIAAGVTVMEPVNGVTECIRAVTTKTMSGGVSDKSASSLNAILIIDDIIPSLRDSLKRVLRGVRTTSMDVVASQVAVELAAKQDRGIIEEYQTPRAYPLSSDPSVCVVELSFKAAYVISQIHVVAHIRI